MKKSLVIVALAAVVGAGTAAADNSAVRIGKGSVSYSTVQHRGEDFRGWFDDGRRQSVDERQARIANRIQNGLENGGLSRREARQVQRQLNATEQKERAFEADGRLSGRERAELHRDLDVVAQRLRFERHDDNRRAEGGRY